MARLIPKVAIEDISVKSERDVAKFLVDLLPDDCVIYHSYPWLRTDRNDKGNTTIREGETDFVVIIPSHGLLLLEVKGGEIKYDSENRQWNRVLPGGRLKEIQDPFEQARRNTHFLENEIKQRGYNGAGSLPFGYGYAAVFPDCEYSGDTPAGATPSIILSASDLQFIDRRIKSALTQWVRREQPIPLSKEDRIKIQRSISPSFNLLPILFRKIEDQEEKLFRLTNDQKMLLDFLAQTERACINGVAGSGKTMLAQAQAEKFADAGMKTLLVCYNKTLAKWLRDNISSDYAESITVTHFHGLCYELCRKAGIPFNPPNKNEDNFWQEDAPELLIEAIELTDDKFDAVIVDEGQDFQSDWWMPLELINSNGDEGAMYVFYDPNQNLYVDQDSSLPALGKPFNLPVNCRNTKSIASLCSNIIDKEIPTKSDAPVGDEPVVIKLDNSYEIQKRVERYVHEWIKKGKLKPNQVAVLCPYKLSNSSLAGMNKARGVEITDDIERWKADKGILFSTVKGFKGLEADAILLIDIPPVNESSIFKQADYYVACSRAKHLLIVISEA
ncbi:NERD domain-containing protein/DEAD/DEAH box helicase [Photobacterium sanguinicancri]|uniref:NERD domain-containing protein/DEAD/DEAH box helicase n=1 Tax=Photobacterium sanguinicancri TaxID=875932 RepID=UPI0026E2E6F1|nr:NERD domain-containing protein/DEAD/DEAH box helicase [Photobacterium sanguinicancri]MDO6497739.1 NERD domain-containing protein/DEAD/DEAH box helicase [Photobacterium sanguinicancri]